MGTTRRHNPIEVTEYSVARTINKEPAHAWWANYTLKKRDRISSAIKRRVVKKSHKFGVRMPSNVSEAHALIKENNNFLWADAIPKEMKNVRVAFDIKEGDEKAPIGYQEIRCHGIFGVKIDEFACGGGRKIRECD